MRMQFCYDIKSTVRYVSAVDISTPDGLSKQCVRPFLLCWYNFFRIVKTDFHNNINLTNSFEHIILFKYGWFVNMETASELKKKKIKLPQPTRNFSLNRYTYRQRSSMKSSFLALVQRCQTYDPRAKTGPLRGWIRPAGWFCKVKASLFAWEVYL